MELSAWTRSSAASAAAAAVATSGAYIIMTNCTAISVRLNSKRFNSALLTGGPASTPPINQAAMSFPMFFLRYEDRKLALVFADENVRL